uniref:8.9 kDa family member n=1 Tax=Rhipicephalus zambeziensis TaxID=60191 RepID=A0A224Y161_9ACAR
MPKEFWFENPLYILRCANFWSFLFIVVLCTYWEKCSTSELFSSERAEDCWFNYTKIRHGDTLGLEIPCVGVICKNGSWGLTECNTTKPSRGDDCEWEQRAGAYPSCCTWVRAC